MRIRNLANRGRAVGALLAAVAVSAALAGCGAAGAKSFPVEGSVRWPDGTDARELSGGAVEFEANNAVVAKAPLQSDGTFVLDRHLPAGHYRARVVPPAGPRPRQLDPRFEKFDTSGLVVRATDQPQFVTFHLGKGRR